MNKQRILITGGSGFIGTQITYELAKHGHHITVVDRQLKNKTAPAELHQEDVTDFLSYGVRVYDTVIHLAADHIVEASVTDPAKYYANNVMKLKGLLDVMVAKKIKNIIFSSSGGVYGSQGVNGPLSENTPYAPENPYSSTKVAGELMIQDYAKAYGINFINFRYFNAGGADPEGRFGYIQRPATHVIPLLCNKILNGQTFQIFGNDYPTRDGTPVRDYIHVADLARAHRLGLEYLDNGGTSDTFNLGMGGDGVSVLELTQVAAQVVNKEPHVIYNPRRDGDPAQLVADITKAQNILNWTPQYQIYQTILDAWNWERKYDTN